MANLDTNAWLVPEDGFLGIAGTPFADSPGIVYKSSQINLQNSICTMNVTASGGPFTAIGGPGQGGPVSVPLKGAGFKWRTQQMLYGTVEVRAKMTGLNTHPAIYMLGSHAQQTADQMVPNVSRFPLGCEIDIVEGEPAQHAGSLGIVNINSWKTSGVTADFAGTANVTDYSQNFHTYRIEWTPASLTWKIDGVQVGQLLTNIPANSMFLIIDIEIDASSGDVNTANFPQSLQLDYVKAWDQNNNLIFSDDFDGKAAFQDLSQAKLTFVQSASKEDITHLSFTQAYPNVTVGGSYLLAFTLFNSAVGNAALTDTLGNTWELIATILRNGITEQLWHVKSNKGAGGANTVNCTVPVTGFSILGILEYTGQSSTPTDVLSSTNTGLGTVEPVTTPNLVTNYIAETLLMWVRNGDGLAGTFNNSFNSRLSGVSSQVAAGDIAKALSGTFSGSYTQGSTGGGWETVLLALRSLASDYQGIFGNVGQAGVTVTYSGPVSGSVVSDAFGNYAAIGLKPGTYSITAGSAFSPTTSSVVLTGGSGYGVDFAPGALNTSRSALDKRLEKDPLQICNSLGNPIGGISRTGTLYGSLGTDPLLPTPDTYLRIIGDSVSDYIQWIRNGSVVAWINASGKYHQINDGSLPYYKAKVVIPVPQSDENLLILQNSVSDRLASIVGWIDPQGNLGGSL